MSERIERAPTPESGEAQAEIDPTAIPDGTIVWLQNHRRIIVLWLFIRYNGIACVVRLDHEAGFVPLPPKVTVIPQSDAEVRGKYPEAFELAQELRKRLSLPSTMP